jgi:hypothetical protein
LFPLLALVAWPANPARAETAPDISAEIARLRSRLAANNAQEQHCLAGATQPVWTASLATDLKALRDHAKQAAAEGKSEEAQRWRELTPKAETLEARTAVSARSGAELFQSQQIGLDCLDRFGGERESLRASLELALADPVAYAASAREARENGHAMLERDLLRLFAQSRALAAQWKQAPDGISLSEPALTLKGDLDTLRRRHTAALESESARALADPVLRPAEALIAAAESAERERMAATRLSAARDDGGRRQALLERNDAGRLVRSYAVTAGQLLARRPGPAEVIRTGTASPGAAGTP